MGGSGGLGINETPDKDVTELVDEEFIVVQIVPFDDVAILLVTSPTATHKFEILLYVTARP